MTPSAVTSKDDPRVWLITGASSGLGRALAEVVLERGERAVVAARNQDALAELERHHADAAVACVLDVTRPEAVRAAVQSAIDAFGHIDARGLGRPRRDDEGSRRR